MSASRHMSARQLATIDRAGDLLLPGDGKFPCFSSTRCVQQIDRVADYMPAQDLGDLKMLLVVLSFLPDFVFRWFFGYLEKTPDMRGPLAPTLRLIRIGMRGLIMTLYYGDPAVHRVMQYDVGVYRG